MVTSPIAVPIHRIHLSPGSHLLIEAVSWEQYEALLVELREDRRIPRINYYDTTLELMAPLPTHERPHRIIGYIVTVESSTSSIFPDIPIVDWIPCLVKRAFEEGTSKMLQELRQQLPSASE